MVVKARNMVLTTVSVGSWFWGMVMPCLDGLHLIIVIADGYANSGWFPSCCQRGTFCPSVQHGYEPIMVVMPLKGIVLWHRS